MATYYDKFRERAESASERFGQAMPPFTSRSNSYRRHSMISFNDGVFTRAKTSLSGFLDDIGKGEETKSDIKGKTNFNFKDRQERTINMAASSIDSFSSDAKASVSESLKDFAINQEAKRNVKRRTSVDEGESRNSMSSSIQSLISEAFSEAKTSVSDLMDDLVVKGENAISDIKRKISIRYNHRNRDERRNSIRRRYRELYSTKTNYTNRRYSWCTEHDTIDLREENRTDGKVYTESERQKIPLQKSNSACMPLIVSVTEAETSDLDSKGLHHLTSPCEAVLHSTRNQDVSPITVGNLDTARSEKNRECVVQNGATTIGYVNIAVNLISHKLKLTIESINLSDAALCFAKDMQISVKIYLTLKATVVKARSKLVKGKNVSCFKQDIYLKIKDSESVAQPLIRMVVCQKKSLIARKRHMSIAETSFCVNKTEDDGKVELSKLLTACI